MAETTERFINIIKNCCKDGYSFTIRITGGKAVVSCIGQAVRIELQTSEGIGEISASNPEAAAKILISLNADPESIEM